MTTPTRVPRLPGSTHGNPDTQVDSSRHERPTLPAAPTAAGDASAPAPLRSDGEQPEGEKSTPPPQPTPAQPEAGDAVEAKLASEPKTSRSVQELSAFLIAPAKEAVDQRQWGRAVSLYQGLVAARGPGSPEALRLAEVWVQAGQYDDAIRVLDGFIESTPDWRERRAAETARQNLVGAINPFSGNFQPERATREAVMAFQQGRTAFKKKRYGDALLYYRVGYALDPDLAGFLRELGATYDRLGARDKKIAFYRAYLHRRPFGSNARFVRRELRSVKDALGSLSIQSALPCDEVWLNRQQAPERLPIKKLAVAPGTYKALCVNYKYQIAYFEYAKVTAGQEATLAFNWAIVVNELSNPHGRISIEDALQDGKMKTLSIAEPEVGVVVPADGRALRMVLRALDRSQQQERFIKLQPGQRTVIRW